MHFSSCTLARVCSSERQLERLAIMGGCNQSTVISKEQLADSNDVGRSFGFEAL
jgi:hypothetical protein